MKTEFNLAIVILSALACAACDQTSSASDPCAQISCSGHGQCQVQDQQAQCACDSGYRAQGLECIPEDSPPCTSVTCSDHGQCVEQDGQAWCECDPGFQAQGLECIPQDSPVCASVTCSGHGQCAVQDGRAVCLCDPGYQTQELECVQVPDPCAGVECSGHGLCQAEAGQPVCQCDPGYQAVEQECVYAENGLAADVQIREVAVFQALKVTIALDGQAVSQRTAPVVANRPALVRVYLDPLPQFSARQVEAALELDSGQILISSTWLDGPSQEDLPDSSILFQLTAAEIDSQTSISVRLIDTNAPAVPQGQIHPARMPTDGSLMSLDAQPDGGGIKLVLVPVEYNTDGSGRLPDLSQEQLAVMEELLLATYPMAQIDVVVHDPLPWSYSLNFFTRNFKFGTLNEELIDLKEAEGAPSETYYYGLVQPAESFADYCFYKCATGQGFVVDDPADGTIRVASGLGFSGERWAWTLVHELGHNHGLGHAPCGTDGESGYPYSGGDIGCWGYDPRQQTFLDPEYKDFMGYCDQRWVSDYNFTRLFERIVALNQLSGRAYVPREGLRFLRLTEQGKLRWGKQVYLTPPRGQERVAIWYRDKAGRICARDEAYLLRTGDGLGPLMVPQGPNQALSLEFLMPGEDSPRSILVP